MEAPKEAESSQGQQGGSAAPLLEISYFTDPLCCWSWGFEPQLRRLRHGYAGRIAWRLRMGGMIGDWSQFSDPINSVHRPSQMGPVWVQAGGVTGMPIEARLWVENPPESSWPSCLAVRAAGLQSATAADLYLRRLREAVMIGGRNIARDAVLLDLGHDLGRSRPDLFDAGRFATDLGSRDAQEALREDIREARYLGVGRFPCLVLRRRGAAPTFLVGWRPYGSLVKAVHGYAPGLGEARQIEHPAKYRAYWDTITDREVEESLRPWGDYSAGEGESGLSSGAGGNG